MWTFPSHRSSITCHSISRSPLTSERSEKKTGHRFGRTKPCAMARRAREDAPSGIWGDLIYIALGIGSSWWLMNKLLSRIPDPSAFDKAKVEEKKRWLQSKFPTRPPVLLDGHEHHVVGEVLDPHEIGVRLADLGGLSDQIGQLRDKILRPLESPDVYCTPLLGVSRGILLYGPPGTGKTMLAQALAVETGAVFINVRASSLQNKWFGETNKLVAAVFSLAKKLQPSIIFVDEVDALLGQRHASEQDFITAYKTEFMQHWEGMTTSRDTRVVVLAATNRPDHLDEAVKRRFPDRFYIGKPDERGRIEILYKTLLKEAAMRGFHAARTDGRVPSAADTGAVDRAILTDPATALRKVAQMTEGFSGSDLTQVCREAARAAARMAEASASGAGDRGAAGSQGGASNPSGAGGRRVRLSDIPPITAAMLEAELLRMKPAHAPMMEGRALAGAANGVGNGTGLDGVVGMSDKGIPVEFEGENGRVMKGVLRLGLLGG